MTCFQSYAGNPSAITPNLDRLSKEGFVNILKLTWLWAVAVGCGMWLWAVAVDKHVFVVTHHAPMLTCTHHG